MKNSSTNIQASNLTDKTNINQKIKSIIRPYYYFIRKVIKEIKFLRGTGAPCMVYMHYLKCKFTNNLIISKYRKEEHDFNSHISSLTLTNDWFTRCIPFWLNIFNKYQIFKKNKIDVLEIGSWEGLSGYFILHNLPNAHLTCVDTWEGADEHQSGVAATKETINNIEKNFNKNLSQYESRLSKYKMPSYAFFYNLDHIKKFDIIYIDGSHHADDVMIDAVKSFEHLKVGGILIFDDYFWQYYDNILDNPAGSINAFLRFKKNSYKIVRVFSQMAIVKTAPISRA